MYYVVQENVFREPNYDLIIDWLDKFALPYEIVQLKGTEHFDFQTERKDVFVFGSVKLARLAVSNGWNPGSLYGGNHDYEIYSAQYKDHLLNYDSVIQKISEPVAWSDRREEKFIRPTKDSKIFTGRLFTQNDWEEFTEETNYLESTVQISTPKTIFKEARVWIVGGKVITSSYYKLESFMPHEDFVEKAGLDFAQQMVDIYQVADAFVMDVCYNLEGWKIVEINCVNSAGFYSGDIGKLVQALEDFYK